MNRLKQLRAAGQSVWLDSAGLEAIKNQELRKLIEYEAVSGISIGLHTVMNAIVHGYGNDIQLQGFLKEFPDSEPATLFEFFVARYVQDAADMLKPVHQRTDGRDGYVSVEIPPLCAYHTVDTINECKRLWSRINRPNVMVKVPATREGIPAIETLLTDGINVNCALMFTPAHYEAVSHAFIRSLGHSRHPSQLASVAGFQINKIDNKIDGLLSDPRYKHVRHLKSKTGIALARIVYHRFRQVFEGTDLPSNYRIQKLLWDGIEVFNSPRDFLYIENLTGIDTVIAFSPRVLKHFRKQGTVNLNTISRKLEESKRHLQELAACGLSLNDLLLELQRECLAESKIIFEKLLVEIEKKAARFTGKNLSRQTIILNGLEEVVGVRMKRWEVDHFSRRFWGKDPSLWFQDVRDGMLNQFGWLDLAEANPVQASSLMEFAESVRKDNYTEIVLAGVGGSSLASKIYCDVVNDIPGRIPFYFLDSIHPDTIRALSKSISFAKSLFIIVSKSGNTEETFALFKYFWHRLPELEHLKGRQFIAITDENSQLDSLAKEKGFLKIFNTPTDVGSRFGSLSVLGTLPAALMGVDIVELQLVAQRFARCCGSSVPETENPALLLGATIGECCVQGKNKLSIHASSSLKVFPEWIEHLIAESTGKEGTGIIPLIAEDRLNLEEYGNDRFFVIITLRDDDCTELDHFARSLIAARKPVIAIALDSRMQIGQEIFRWQMAVAAAASIIHVHPFNKPDVELTRHYTSNIMKVDSSPTDRSTLLPAHSINDSLVERVLGDWLNGIKSGDYLVLLAYLSRTTELKTVLYDLKNILEKYFKIPVCLKFGPQYLHCTGQLYKGGPKTGYFLQLIDNPEIDLPVPEEPYSFGKLIRAQGIGDFRALKGKKQAVFRLELGSDTYNSLVKLRECLHEIRRQPVRRTRGQSELA